MFPKRKKNYKRATRNTDELPYDPSLLTYEQHCKLFTTQREIADCLKIHFLEVYRLIKNGVIPEPFYFKTRNDTSCEKFFLRSEVDWQHAFSDRHSNSKINAKVEYLERLGYTVIPPRTPLPPFISPGSQGG